VDVKVVRRSDELACMLGRPAAIRDTIVGSRAHDAHSDMTAAPRVAVLGLGEAGSTLAADLVAQGVEVFGWDPAGLRDVAGLNRAGSPAAAVAQAKVVLSVNTQAAAVAAAESVRSTLTSDHLYADLNTTAPSVKLAVGETIASSGADIVDVALLTPVLDHGLRTPALASGPGAGRFAAIFRPLGMPVDVLDGHLGDAARLKLLRSVFMKGIAASILESLAAAREAGCDDWLRTQIETTFTSADAGFVDRLIVGSETHATRRVDEMEAAAELLRELGVQPAIATAAADVLRSLAVSEAAARR
jgi:3-hydroxyisobutyrate dehydrogenase-like beta-hydroxyacid dehydrogenase